MLTAFVDLVLFASDVLLFSVNTLELLVETDLVATPFLPEASRTPELDVVLLEELISPVSFALPTVVLLFLPEDEAATPFSDVRLPSFLTTLVPEVLLLP